MVALSSGNKRWRNGSQSVGYFVYIITYVDSVSMLACASFFHSGCNGYANSYTVILLGEHWHYALRVLSKESRAAED
jgi:hypothetical protein